MPRLVKVADYGGFAVVTPMDGGSRAWLDEHIVGEVTRWAGGIVVERDYLDDLLGGMGEDGITIEFE
jgi:hypothetical protein